MTSSVNTYLTPCLHDGKTARWAETTMPIAVYIAPFRWYEAQKQAQADVYRQMILNALGEWRRASGHKVAFRLVSDRRESQLDVAWRRVDRRSLGHCKYLINEHGILYSAEIEIGISDGRVHQEYNHPDEVYHTILHEVGHALGLIGHSDHPADIMFTPHQYGVCSLSPRDEATMHWLYRLPYGFDPVMRGKAMGLADDTLTMPAVLSAWQGGGGDAVNGAQPASKPTPPATGLDLETQQRLLDYQGRFLLATQPKKPPRK